MAASHTPWDPTESVAVVVTGELPYAEGGGDTLDLSLPRDDRELIEELKEAVRGCTPLPARAA